ncbi:MAG: signal peptide peptidase SppA, partial [Treponema sp.]|nr:signal peptide peptidase SppA [Treponema sp.]
MIHFRKFVLVCVIFLLSFSLFAESYLELNLNDAVTANPFARKESTLEVFRVIEKATTDKNVKGIILNIGSINRSREYLWELRSSLEQFKASGKNIVAYINNADIDIYMLASVADKIVMDELGILVMLGYSAGKGYVTQTLNKLGIGAMELRYFEYKSAAEGYTRTNMSAADRRQYTDYLDDIFNHTRSILMEARGWTLEEFNKYINVNFMHSASSAVTHKLADYTGGKSAVQNAIMEIEDYHVSNYFLYGDTNSSLTGSIFTYSAPKAGGSIFKRPPVVAVVYADGQTDMTRGMEIAKLTKTITDLANNGRVKAIVVRINSPGGSAQAAEALAEAIRLARYKKPVVVSMGQVAASGGYWASITANHIMATPYTVTGSIGVIGSWFYDNGLYNKIGINMDILKRGDHSDLMAGFLIPYRKLTAAEEEQYKKYIVDLYDIFIDKVAFGRSMEIQKVEAVAQGRIFSGIRALEEGLIDSVGSLSDALSLACSLADIPEGAPVNYREYPEPKLMDILLGKFPVMAKLFGTRPQSAPDFLDMIIPEAGIRYRLENNGQVMPILPLEFSMW